MRLSFAFVFFAAAVSVACSNSGPTVVTNSNTNTNTSTDRPLRSGQMQQQNTIAHTTENQPPKASNSNGSGKWTASGDPIDTARFDGVIAEAEKAVKSNPNDEGAKKTLAQAYFDRGAALTEARQYASALGDYRRALKFDPSHEESKKWIDQIIGIYAMLKKDYPKEGEEPPPLPLNK